MYRALDRLVEKIVDAAVAVTDKIILSWPRVAGVGYGVYFIWFIGVYLAALRDIALGMKGPLDSFVSMFLSNSPWPLGILLVGPIIVQGLSYVDESGRTRSIEQDARFALSVIYEDAPRHVVRRRDIFLFIILYILVFAALMVNKLLGDEATILCIRLLSRDPPRGFIASMLEVASLSLAFVFGMVIAVSLGYVIMAHRNTLKLIQRGVDAIYNGEMKGVLDRALGRVISSERPALEFIRLIHGMQRATYYMNSLIKRFIVILLIIIAYIMMTYVKAPSFFIISSVALIGGVLASIAVYQLYVSTRWSGELKRLMLVSLRDIRIRAYVGNDHATATVSNEIEKLLRELGQPLIHRRELWELVAAITTLVSAIIAMLSSL